MTCAPRSRIICATVDLPQARPPVSPTRSMSAPQDLGRSVQQASQLGSANGVRHQHGDSQRADPAGDRREGASNFGGFGMHIAHERETFLAELPFALGIASKKA